jgi:glycosyltransferase involved in cell wall biosynthesis
MKLVFVTQAIDADDPNLAATIDMVRALARRSNEVVVICDRFGRHDLPGNVAIETFAASTRLGRGLRYLRALTRVLATGRSDAILAHMCPIYVVLAAPLAKPLRIPLLLWYTHWTIDRTLKAATFLCDAALSVDTRSYPLASPKVSGIGHGIDVAEFRPRDRAPEGAGPLRLLALGRTSPSKGFMTLLDALERACADGLDATLELRGPATTDEERRHRAELKEAIQRPVLAGRVRLEEPVSRDRVPDLMRGFDVVVNPTKGQTRGGALDKVVYESAACAVPVVACNPHFDGFLGGLPLELRFASADPDDLARVLRAFASAGATERTETGRELRRRAEASHSVEAWADGVLRVTRQLRS